MNIKTPRDHAPSTPAETGGLRPNAVGTAGIVFFVVAAASPLSAALGMAAVTCSMINVTGGYLITFRMIKMFKRKGAQK